MAEVTTYTVADVEAAVKRIREEAFDPEVAHSHEDQLHVLVLALVAAGHPESKALALAALQSTQIEFPRWCA